MLCAMTAVAAGFIVPGPHTGSLCRRTTAAAPAIGRLRRQGEGTVVMGIPKMFRWLTDQYPQIMERATMGLDDGAEIRQVDNLYLDMNGIIHPLTHSDDGGIEVPSPARPHSVVAVPVAVAFRPACLARPALTTPS